MTSAPARWRVTTAWALALALLVAGPLAVLTAEPLRLTQPFALPWWTLVPVYLAAARLNLAFERRGSNVGVTLVQVPLAVGLVLVSAGLHLVARLIATATLCAWRRQPPLQALYNLGVSSVEVGAPVAVVSATHLSGGHPGPAFWAALLVGLLVGELVACLSINVVLRLLHQPVSWPQFVEHLTVALGTTVVFTGLAVLTLAAAWTDPWTLAVVAALAVALAAAYRAHGRVAAQQRATERLYAFVKDLGPVDAEQPEVLEVLDRVRELLHAEHLEFVSVGRDGRVLRRLVVHRDAPADVGVDEHEALPPARESKVDSIRTPLLSGSTVVGLLTARERIGSDRRFDLGDRRLLETVAAELGTALDRGRLLRELGRAATTDAMTGLPNLRRTTSDLDLLLSAAPDGVLLAAVSVESFREVNDTLGHEVGDELLREVARRLRAVSAHAVLGRIGGGRFALAVPADGRDHDPEMFGLDLRSRLEGDAELEVVTTQVRVSVGCVGAPEHGRDAPTLLRRAETAMYAAQHAHGGPVLWEPAYELRGQRRLAIVMALREALASGAVGAAFQPKIDAATGTCTGVEALARWQHPALGPIAPEEFVPLAEAAGLLNLLTSAMLRQALQACSAWQAPGRRVGVAVNVSAETLQHREFVADVAEILSTVGIRPDLLTLELTEDIVVADPQLAAERMGELRALGVRLSVDDFGTGYSSLTYLKGLPVDEVKIDKGFVQGLVADAGDQAVVRAVVDIAHTLGLRVVAEGVEQEDQHGLLRRLGVDELQGYLHARPMPALDVTRWLQRQHRVPGLV